MARRRSASSTKRTEPSGYLLMTRNGHQTLIGCRAMRSCTNETFVLLERPFSIPRYRRASAHQAQEVPCTGAVLPTTVLFRPATQARFSRTIRGSEKKLLRECCLNYW